MLAQCGRMSWCNGGEGKPKFRTEFDRSACSRSGIKALRHLADRSVPLGQVLAGHAVYTLTTVRPPTHSYSVFADWVIRASMSQASPESHARSNS